MNKETMMCIPPRKAKDESSSSLLIQKIFTYAFQWIRRKTFKCPFRNYDRNKGKIKWNQWYEFIHPYVLYYSHCAHANILSNHFSIEWTVTLRIPNILHQNVFNMTINQCSFSITILRYVISLRLFFDKDSSINILALIIPTWCIL